MKYVKELALMFLVSMLSFFTVAFAAEPAKPTPKTPVGELKIGVTSLVTETFHPFRAPNIRKFYYEVMFDYLVNLDEEMNLAEGIASKWEEAPNHLSWTFYIRDGVKFHDGTPLTLEDVKFSLDTMLDEKNVCVRSQFQPYQERVEIVPPNKVVIHLKAPWVVMPYILSPAGQGG